MSDVITKRPGVEKGRGGCREGRQKAEHEAAGGRRLTLFRARPVLASDEASFNP